MGKPREEVKEKDYYKDIHFFYEITNSFKEIDELKRFLKDILTSSELRMIKRRWHIANLIMEGLDIRTVALRSKSSTQTVSKIKRILDEGYGGLKLALERMEVKIKRDREKYLKSKIPARGSKFVKGWFR